MRIIAAILVLLLATTAMAGKSAEERAFEIVKDNQMGSCASMMEKSPFQSIMPYALDNGIPVVLLADIAQHSENLNKNSVASFLVEKRDEDNIHNSARVSMQGKLTKVSSKKDAKRLMSIYVKRYPQAKLYVKVHKFSIYYMKDITSIHFIGGFGDIHWLDVDDYHKAAKGKHAVHQKER